MSENEEQYFVMYILILKRTRNYIIKVARIEGGGGGG